MGADYALVLNCGSSSIKFAVVSASSGERPVSGIVEKINSDNAHLKFSASSYIEKTDIGNVSYDEALDKILCRVAQQNLEIIAAGHRVVHGGEKFKASVLIDKAVLNAIEECSDLAPLHNPSNLAGIIATQKQFPDLPQAAVFDTAFHQSMPPENYLYAIPQQLYHEHKIRRYGFHGTSHRFVSQRALEILKLPLEKSAFITAHLGNGCSASAIYQGKSLDTTMGLTPLEGLMMGTRSGDVDPGLHYYLKQKTHMDLEAINSMLNKESGLLGISGTSMDMRDLKLASESGDENATLARKMFCFRAAKSIAALTASLPHLDALIFTGGIGENDAEARASILSHLSIFGFQCNDENNKLHGQESDHLISNNTPKALVIPTDEEWLIAQDTLTLTRGQK